MEVKIPNSTKVDVIGVMVRLQCKECFSKWGVYLLEDGAFPQGWDVCLKCEGKKSYYGKVKEQVKYGDRTI